MTTPSPAQIKSYLASPKAFRADAIIKAGRQFVRRGDVVDSWQLQDEEALDPAWIALSNPFAPTATIRFAYWERGRAHSKTNDGMLSAMQPIVLSRRKLLGICAAGDQDQASFLLQAGATYRECMPWTEPRFEIQSRAAVNPKTGSRLNAIASNAPTSWGHLVDFILLDELTTWSDSGEELFNSLYSAAEKQPHCVLLIISNAGVGQGEPGGAGGSWQWRVREMARLSPDWYFSSLDGPQASWIKPASIERQRIALPEIEFERVVMNRWTSGYSNLLPAERIDAAIIPHTNLNQPPPGPMTGNEPGWVFVAGYDGAISHDKATLVAVAKRGTEIRLANTWSFSAPKGGEISQSEVASTIIEAHRKYRFAKVAADPHDASGIVQHCQNQRVPIDKKHQTGKVLIDQATAVLEAFKTHTFTMYRHEELLYDLRHARIESRSYGYRIVSDRNRFGHGDHLTALSIALAEAREIHAPANRTWGGIVNALPGPSRLGGTFAGTYLPAQHTTFDPLSKFGSFGEHF
jgi:hypothetical protein